MPSDHEELDALRERIGTFLAEASPLSVDSTLGRIEEIVRRIANAWSGSWIGYQASVYYANLEAPPPGAHFSSEMGLMQLHFSRGTSGDWREYPFDEVRAEIFARAGNPDLSAIRDWAERGARLVSDIQADVGSILQHATGSRADPFLDRLREEADKVVVFSSADIIEHLRPSGNVLSRDSIAISQGFRVPPHVSVVAEIGALRSPANAFQTLARICKQASAHLARLQKRSEKASRIGTNVFIGHGRSALWRELKDFVQDRMRLPWEEFNRVPVAGVTNITRLSEMLDSSAIAFLVLTAEDEQANGKFHARANVIHEAGLFQGRLGFTRAIVVLEDGCEEFSNIQGLGQIRFPAGNIKASFEDVRQVLEREGLVGDGV
jgi:predicted nucleotide-binding protein